ncbi:hypothetical protein SKAU_G00322380 [Synaphobranchus kaupii]|uniref:DNA-repair protein Xrcc1 N-terminal domain-containing protein n=1 Tax=Synaphobranchus kaupii TaxID=118154 RepID=A0A9Q1EP41_SYNKA|nr:hypothetical protein SKAU_G00322380 [Synaphobranchus kaupii]
MERATAIGYIDVGNCGSAFIQIDVGRSSWPLERSYVTLLPTATMMSPADSKQEKGRTGVRMFKRGDFLPAGADELWDRVRVTCSQPFNRRAQFGLSFLRIRSPEEEGADESFEGSEGQRTPEQQTSKVERVVVQPRGSKDVLWTGNRGRGPQKSTRRAGTRRGSGRGVAGLSRAARMVISAAQSGRRSLLPALPSSASPPDSASSSSIQRRTKPIRPDRAQGTCTEGEASSRNPAAVHHKKAGRRVKRKPDSEKSPQAHSAPCWKRPKSAVCEQSLGGSSSPCSTSPPGGPEDPRNLLSLMRRVLQTRILAPTRFLLPGGGVRRGAAELHAPL